MFKPNDRVRVRASGESGRVTAVSTSGAEFPHLYRPAAAKARARRPRPSPPPRESAVLAVRLDGEDRARNFLPQHLEPAE